MMHKETSEAELAWIDVESTGLHVDEGHYMLQIACIVTDRHFNELGVYERKVKFSEEEVAKLKEKAGDFVTAMHEKTGLWDKLLTAELSYDQIDAEFSEWLKSFSINPLIFAGNSITLDREFVRAYLPMSYARLHYRNLDATSVENFFRFTEGREPYKKKLTHEALEDIRESIAQTIYHRDMNTPF